MRVAVVAPPAIQELSFFPGDQYRFTAKSSRVVVRFTEGLCFWYALLPDKGSRHKAAIAAFLNPHLSYSHKWSFQITATEILTTDAYRQLWYINEAKSRKQKLSIA